MLGFFCYVEKINTHAASGIHIANNGMITFGLFKSCFGFDRLLQFKVYS